MILNSRSGNRCAIFSRLSMAYCSLCGLYFPKEYSLERHHSVVTHRIVCTSALPSTLFSDKFVQVSTGCVDRLLLFSDQAKPANYSHSANVSDVHKADIELEENLHDFMLHLHCLLYEYLFRDDGDCSDELQWPDFQRTMHLFDSADLQLFFWGIRSYLPVGESIEFYTDFQLDYQEYIENETRDWVRYFSGVLTSEVNTLFWTWQILRSEWVVIEFHKIFPVGMDHILHTILFHLLAPPDKNDAIYKECKSMLPASSHGRWLALDLMRSQMSHSTVP